MSTPKLRLEGTLVGSRREQAVVTLGFGTGTPYLRLPTPSSSAPMRP